MRFDLQGIEYDTATMASFETGQPCLPIVYVNADGLIFLETRRDRWQEPRVRRIPRFEALRIASLYGLAELKRFLLTEKRMEQSSGRELSIESDDRNLIQKIHELTPEQLERLAESLQLSRN